jgi:hypothetical protein
MGYMLDPEAFFLSFFECTQKCQPPIPVLPPILLDNNPLFLRAVIRGSGVSLQDRSGTAGPLPTATTDPLGHWLMERVPNRDEPYFISSDGKGSLPTEPIFPVLSPLPPVSYVPTVTLRPMTAGVSDSCWGLESNQLSNKGILDALARFLSATGTPTTVADFTNPSKFAGVAVFWLGNPGFPYLRAPAANTTVEATAGQVINVEWAPPGFLPPPYDAMQSERGFFVAGAPVSSMGIAAVLVPATGSPPASVTYKFVDSTTDAAAGRPWYYPSIQAPLTPGAITYGGIQMYHSTGPKWPPSPYFCLPHK